MGPLTGDVGPQEWVGFLKTVNSGEGHSQCSLIFHPSSEAKGKGSSVDVVQERSTSWAENKVEKGREGPARQMGGSWHGDESSSVLEFMFL